MAVIAIAALIGLFFAVTGFRGLIEVLDRASGRCVGCGRTPALPLPTQNLCWRCHHAAAGWTRRLRGSGS